MVIDVTWIEIIVFGSPVYDLILVYTGLHFVFRSAVSLNLSQSIYVLSPTSRQLTILPIWRQI